MRNTHGHCLDTHVTPFVTNCMAERLVKVAIVHVIHYHQFPPNQRLLVDNL